MSHNSSSHLVETSALGTRERSFAASVVAHVVNSAVELGVAVMTRPSLLARERGRLVRLILHLGRIFFNYAQPCSPPERVTVDEPSWLYQRRHCHLVQALKSRRISLFDTKISYYILGIAYSP